MQGTSGSLQLDIVTDNARESHDHDENALEYIYREVCAMNAVDTGEEEDAVEVQLRGAADAPGETNALEEGVGTQYSFCDGVQIAAVMREEISLMLRLCAPSVVITVFAFLIWFLNAIYAARLGPAALAGVSLGTLTQNLCGFSVVVGLLGAVDTLAPQAVGAGNFRELTASTQVGYLVQVGLTASMLVAYPLMAALWLNAEPLLLLLGQPPEVSVMAGSYLRIAILGMPARIIFELCRKFLNAQRIVMMPFLVVVPLVCAVVHPLLLEYCVGRWGFNGIAIASVTSLWLMALLCVAYTAVIKPHHADSWPKWDLREALSWERVALFARLGCCGLMSMSEWLAIPALTEVLCGYRRWFWEAVCFMVGMLGTRSLAAHSVAYNMVPLCFMIPLGFSIGLNIRVGNLMGEGRVRRAQTLVQVTLMLCSFVLVADAAVLWLLAEPIVAIYSSDPGLTQVVLQIWPYMCLHVVATGYYCLCSAVLRALGLQLRSAAVIVCTLWLLGLPALCTIVFVLNWGLVGLWGLLAPLYLLLSVLLGASFTVKTDWYQIAANIKERMNQPSAHKGSNLGDDVGSSTTEYTPVVVQPNSPIHSGCEVVEENEINRDDGVAQSALLSMTSLMKPENKRDRLKEAECHKHSDLR